MQHATCEVPGEALEPLQALAERHGTPLRVVLLTAWALVLTRLAGRDAVTLGLLLAAIGIGMAIYLMRVS